MPPKCTGGCQLGAIDKYGEDECFRTGYSSTIHQTEDGYGTETDMNIGLPRETAPVSRKWNPRCRSLTCVEIELARLILP
jgi:hypothetical protein